MNHQIFQTITITPISIYILKKKISEKYSTRDTKLIIKLCAIKQMKGAKRKKKKQKKKKERKTVAEIGLVAAYTPKILENL